VVACGACHRPEGVNDGDSIVPPSGANLSPWDLGNHSAFCLQAVMADD